MRGGRFGLAGQASGGGLGGAVAGCIGVGGCGVGGGGLGGLAAHGVAEAEEAGAEQREREEDAEDGRRAERDLAVGAAAGIGAVRVADVAATGRTVLVVEETLSPSTPLPPHPARRSERRGARSRMAPMDLLNMLTNSMGSGKTMVVFFSTPISVRVCR